MDLILLLDIIFILIAVVLSIILFLTDKYSKEILIDNKELSINLDRNLNRWIDTIRDELQLTKAFEGENKIITEKGSFTGSTIYIRIEKEKIYLKPRVTVPSNMFLIVVIILLFFFGLGAFIAIYAHLKSDKLGKSIISKIEILSKM
jgi:hypothetical protein